MMRISGKIGATGTSESGITAMKRGYMKAVNGGINRKANGYSWGAVFIFLVFCVTMTSRMDSPA